VVYYHVVFENVQLVRPPAQGDGLVGVLNYLGLGAKLRQCDVLPNYVVELPEIVQN